MTRKNRKLTDFGDVADSFDSNNNDNVNVDIHDDVHIDMPINEHNDVNIPQNMGYLKEIVEGSNKKKKPDLISTGIYFEPEVYEILMTLSKKGGRGFKSKIVNDATKEVFKGMGLMK